MIRCVTTQEVSDTGSVYLATLAPWERVAVTCMLRSRRCKLLAKRKQTQQEKTKNERKGESQSQSVDFSRRSMQVGEGGKDRRQDKRSNWRPLPYYVYVFTLDSSRLNRRCVDHAPVEGLAVLVAAGYCVHSPVLNIAIIPPHN